MKISIAFSGNLGYTGIRNINWEAFL